MKVKQGTSKYVLLVGILALIIAGALLAYQVYAALTKTQISEEEKINIRPIDGSIDQEVVKDLLTRRQFSDDVAPLPTITIDGTIIDEGLNQPVASGSANSNSELNVR